MLKQRKNGALALVIAVLVTLGSVFVGTVVGGPRAYAAPVPQGDAPGPACAWQLMSNSTDLNVAFPDTSATYWIIPYALGPGDSIVLSGRYPDARYFSLNTYGTDFNTVDTLRDNQIRPSAGVNPFATQVSAGAGGRWQARVINGTPDHQRNQLNGVRPGQSSPVGFLIYRVYVPRDAQSLSGGVYLPTVTMNVAGSSVTLRPCAQPFDPSAYSGVIADVLTRGFDKVIGGAAAGAFAGGAPEATFIDPASTSGLFPNGDNKYIGAGLTYRPGRVAVIRAKAPTFPDTTAGISPATPGTSVRYWSMCQNDKISPYPVVACAADYQTALDADGYYTYVVAAPADMVGSADPDITVINWGSTNVDKVVFIRNMLPSKAFYPLSVQAAQAPGANLAVTMGAYYPRATYCDVGVLRAQGWRACYR